MTTRRGLRLTAVGALVVLVAAACTGGAGTGSLAPSTSAGPGTPAPVTALPATPAPSPPVASAEPSPTIVDMTATVPGAYIDAAITDAATRADVDPADVTVVEAGAQTFSDSSLGCPEPGMMYLQVITPGYRIVVVAGGTTYDYRAAARGGVHVRLCVNPLPQG